VRVVPTGSALASPLAEPERMLLITSAAEGLASRAAARSSAYSQTE